jgi:outer membrane protein assembly factor BamB
VAAGSESGQLLVVDADAGTVRWSITHPGEIAVAPRGDGRTVVASWHTAGGSTLRAFDAGTGALRWEVPRGRVATPPALSGTAVVVAHGEGIHSAVVEALDLATGAVRWQALLPGWWDGALEPAVAADAVYLLDGMGTVVALDPASGGVRWRQETARPLVDGRLVLTPSAVVFASYDDELVVLDRADGRLRAAEAQPGVPVDLAAAPGRLVVALRLAVPSRVEARPAP